MKFSGLLAGLGNPGAKYEGTRHNCGFMLVQKMLDLASQTGSVEKLNGKKFNALLWRVEAPKINGIWLVAEPQTFMNDSGTAIRPIMAWHNLTPSQLVVAQDELDLPPGELRFKFGGGLAGHNGLLSISQCLGTKDFYRLRIGIGKPTSKADMLAWVLGRPQAEDAKKIGEAVAAGLDDFLIYANDGYQAAVQYARSVGR